MSSSSNRKYEAARGPRQRRLRLVMTEAQCRATDVTCRSSSAVPREDEAFEVTSVPAAPRAPRSELQEREAVPA